MKYVKRNFLVSRGKLYMSGYICIGRRFGFLPKGASWNGRNGAISYLHTLASLADRKRKLSRHYKDWGQDRCWVMDMFGAWS